MANEPEVYSRVFRVGRLALWVVLALMLLSIAYAGWRAIANWTAITV